MIQDDVRQALLTMGTPLPPLGMDPRLAQPAPHLTVSASALELAEAAHAAQGSASKKPASYKRLRRQRGVKKEAEAAEQAAQASRKLQAQLQAQLQ